MGSGDRGKELELNWGLYNSSQMQLKPRHIQDSGLLLYLNHPRSYVGIVRLEEKVCVGNVNRKNILSWQEQT